MLGLQSAAFRYLKIEILADLQPEEGDAVLTGAPDRNFTVLGTGILRDTFAIVGAVNVHFASAVGAVHQAGKRVRFAPAVRVATHVSPDTLHIVKSLLVDDGLMSIFNNCPLAFVHYSGFSCP